MSNTRSEQTISMLPAGQGKSYLLLGTEVVTFKASASQTAGAFLTVEATVPREAVLPCTSTIHKNSFTL